jgi:hypothetical protein
MNPALLGMTVIATLAALDAGVVSLAMARFRRVRLIAE